jgi:hypothetical protein
MSPALVSIGDLRSRLPFCRNVTGKAFDPWITPLIAGHFQRTFGRPAIPKQASTQTVIWNLQDLAPFGESFPHAFIGNPAVVLTVPGLSFGGRPSDIVASVIPIDIDTIKATPCWARAEYCVKPFKRLQFRGNRDSAAAIEKISRMCRLATSF